MKMIQRSILALLLFAGCDTNQASQHEPEVVVEAYLVADKPMPPIRLTWTSPITGQYDSAALAIRDANVVVKVGTGSGVFGTTVSFVHDETNPGVYRPIDTLPVVPETTYRLEATIPGQSTVVSAETVVPGAFEITSVTAEAVVYQGPVRYEVEVTRSATTRSQSIFVFSIQALEPNLANLTPFYLDTIYGIKDGEPYDPDSLAFSEIEPFLVNASPPINEANYTSSGDGSITIRLPWFALVFYGRHRVSTSAIDDAIYDFMRYQQVQQGGSTLSPGEIPNVLDHVTGGRGVFGSMATVSAEMVLLRE